MPVFVAQKPRIMTTHIEAQEDPENELRSADRLWGILRGYLLLFAEEHPPPQEKKNHKKLYSLQGQHRSCHFVLYSFGVLKQIVVWWLLRPRCWGNSQAGNDCSQIDFSGEAWGQNLRFRV